MARLTTLALTTAAVAALALTGCAAPASSGDGDTGSGNTPAEQPASGGGGDSFATVTVDDRTWEYSSYACARGYETTESDIYSFSSSGFTTADGEKIQSLVDVADPSGQDRIQGDGVRYEITVYDWGNSDDPSVEIALEGTSGVTITDDTVVVSGDFEVSDGSGTMMHVEVDARCS